MLNRALKRILIRVQPGKHDGVELRHARALQGTRFAASLNFFGGDATEVRPYRGTAQNNLALAQLPSPLKIHV